MTSSLTLDAEALYAIAARWRAPPAAERASAALVGIWSGGAWLAARLQADLQRARRSAASSAARCTATITASAAWLPAPAPTRLPFAIDGAAFLLIDDVLYTGRTIRAVLNELFDFGRPASVALAVLVDRGGRELPVQPSFAAARVALSRRAAPVAGARR